MVKLNYTARKISGIKAAQALKKDLSKRVPVSSTFRLRDPVLEIDISGKQLTDDEFKVFILDLRYALEYKSSEYPRGVNKLQELHLQGNSLTSDSLVELAKAIFLSSQDLKELDISSNKINIVTTSDVQKWQYFLQSFSQCCVLKKIDFSNNALGSQGIEVLARVYIRSELDFVDTELATDAEMDTDAVSDAITQHGSPSVSLENGHRMSDAGLLVPSYSATTGVHSPSQGIRSSQRRGSQLTTPSSKGYTDAELRHFACTRGLRSVPYLILQNVAMTNGGIIHLAEMFKLHRTPEHLLSFLPCGKPPSLPDSENALRGIHWLPNEHLSPLSVKLMKLMSQLKQSSAESDSEDELLEELHDLALDEDTYGLERRQKRQKLNLELNRVVKLQRIDVLGSEGLLKSEIWHSAFRMLLVARAILLDDENRPPSVEKELRLLSSSRKSRSSESREKSTPARSPLPLPQHVQTSTNQWSTPPGVLISSFRFDPESLTFDLMFPAMHAPPEHPVLQAHPPPVAAAMSAYSSPTTQSPQQQQITIATGGHSPHGRATGAAGDTSTSPNPTSAPPPNRHRFGLPLHIWAKIISEALSVKRLLHPDQQMRILTYAASWNALAAEVSINGAPEHQQLWKILDRLGLGLAKLYLEQPNTRVILTTRSTTPSDILDALCKSVPGTLEGIYKLDSASTEDAIALRESLMANENINKIDVLIANAGVGEPFDSVLEAPIDALEMFYQVNTLGPIRLYQQLWKDLLEKSDNPKFVLVSSILGSLTYIDPTPCGGYGAAKAAANYLVKKMHLESEKLVALSLHPGWVKTANGQAYADAVNVPEPPMTTEESVNAIFKTVSEATKDSTSGKFIDAMSGKELPW
ncbi:hypothetical protein UA08_03767 [Talaromyces atroroseus]|uniref:Uncharacterized protein n=1 Tax=Talaromyces atroroseus TaxID=1441469 RepID=A0A225B231_TALAT|nr:hypothetical protein UA08_03767 [Talaromyces atroroseus]OKL61286.1 hypothetical protein UA08_03767 [Talaromyces atroroseus]